MRKRCDIDDCGQRVHGHGMCTKHYLRWYAHGDPRYQVPIITICRVDECDKPPRSRTIGICEAHYYRMRRNGTLELKNMRRDDTEYRAAHSRIYQDRGPARSYPCVDCGVQAQHWSYQNTDTAEMISNTGLTYSLSPEHYAPRCASCHARFDGTGANQYTRR